MSAPDDVPARMAGTPSAASDTAVARWFEQWLQREHPGTAWRVGEGLQDRGGLEATTGEIDGAGPGGVDDDAGGIAA